MKKELFIVCIGGAVAAGHAHGGPVEGFKLAQAALQGTYSAVQTMTVDTGLIRAAAHNARNQKVIDLREQPYTVCDR
ncbi:MAG: hypothetical protein H6618_09565 [Deltaproteobacteria bacterium]|nr:hypothetical protein [Deltaproteobacteria bacterium]